MIFGGFMSLKRGGSQENLRLVVDNTRVKAGECSPRSFWHRVWVYVFRLYWFEDLLALMPYSSLPPFAIAGVAAYFGQVVVTVVAAGLVLLLVCGMVLRKSLG